MVDLHMHTIYSDGDRTVEELLKLCEEQKLEYISITDHDNCKQYEDEAFKKGIFSGKIIKGSELHAVHKNRKYEILAYGIDTEILGKWYQKYYSDEKLIESQKLAAKMVIDIFNKLGVKYNLDNIEWPTKPTEYVERRMYKEAFSYSENKEIFGDYNDSCFGLFFRKEITNPQSPFFMPPIGMPEHKEVVEAIHNAGGKAFLAHPFEYRFEDTIAFIDEIRKIAELDGIEVYHPSSVDDDKKDILYEYARKNNLYISGGSDFHGSVKPDLKIGVGRGNINIPKEIIEEWI